MGLLSKLSSYFLSPLVSYDKEGEKNIASYLNVILIVSLVILPLFIVIKIVQAGAIYSSDYIKLGLEFIFIALFYLLRKGRFIFSGISFLLISWIALTTMAYYENGIQDVAIVGYIVIIFLATLLVGIRISFLITVLSIISVWVLGILQMKNGLVPMVNGPLEYSRDYTLIFILVLIAIILFSRNYHSSYERLNRVLKERIKVEEKLSQNENILREQNEELVYARDKAEESDRLKTSFLHNISHEIRTPMNGIVGFLDLLKHTDTDKKKQEDYIGIINTCTQQLASLVNDLIDISKIETGTVELNISVFHSDLLVRELENTFRIQASNKGLSFSVINEISNWRLKADQGKISQVLNNLVSNAIKFTHAGSVSVRISKDQNDLLITVKDTGIGIKESEKELIFKRFRQAEMGLSRSFEGSGLGLAISKGNVDFLGGKIWLDSKPGSGSLFSFTLPAEFIAGQGPVPEAGQEINLTGKLKILVAEDDHINYLYLKELLGDSNCELVWAKDGLEAVEKIGTITDFDVVLMDLKMPVMNGYEATLKIKDKNPAIPVIAVTAFALEEDINMAPGARFDGYVVKPIDRNDLISKLRRIKG